jgi:uncharacterized coiled-coil protein SlyX
MNESGQDNLHTFMVLVKDTIKELSDRVAEMHTQILKNKEAIEIMAEAHRKKD